MWYGSDGYEQRNLDYGVYLAGLALTVTRNLCCTFTMALLGRVKYWSYPYCR